MVQQMAGGARGVTDETENREIVYFDCVVVKSFK